ncbi:MAG: DUF3098 domain-containing protein [Balneolaceae bacterium]
MTKRSSGKGPKKPMLFSSVNYKWMGVGCLLVIVGFTLMYLDNDVYGFISLTVSPVIVITGYLLVAFGILKKEAAPADTFQEN